MNQSNNVVYLCYSPILSIPIVGDLCYLVQRYVINHNLSKKIYIARGKSLVRSQIVMDLKKNDVVFCQTYKLGSLLEGIKSDIVFDIDDLYLKKMSRSDLYDLMWTLVFCDSVTIACRKSLNNFLPLDFPTHELEK
jgi:hypothetical protein